MIRRRFSKRDANHQAIVRALRDAGRQVIELHALGGSCPDLLVCWPAGMRLLEVKDGKAPLTAGQKAFQATWRGPPGGVAVVRSEREALAATGIVIPLGA